ncbi:MAG: methionine synthase [Duncaniella sp.]|nr:methionine synthase [Duncaniella sp.]
MESFQEQLRKRILILDGAMGTMLQRLKLTEADFRGERFADWHCDLRGNNDLLNLTKPDVIADICRQYIDAGADIVSTNTFNSNSISMADYDMREYVSEINRAGAELMRRVADKAMEEKPGRKIWVAGSMGPTNKTASMSPDVSDPGFRAVNYDDLYNAYYQQVVALIEGGVDLLLFETIFDSLNVKAALDAAATVMEQLKEQRPIMLSLTLSGNDGRTFSGQTLKAFLASVEHANIATIGLNCSFGASQMKRFLAELASVAPYPISAHPNAGLPNAMGTYDETPEKMASLMTQFVDEGLVNIIGGCCGTTPAHIAKYPDVVKDKKPHIPSLRHDGLWLSGLELLEIKPRNNFVNVGERCNVAGSRKFLRLIKERKHDEALAIARKQVEDGAQIIDINMDDGMLDASQEMTTFLNLIAAEPDICRVPVMIDSSNWDVIEAGIKCVQGKSIVNSISLKEGEDKFLEHARRLRQLGAAVVVMAFDEDGQADTYERKIEVSERAYKLLTKEAEFDPQNIIFDPNILAIATGMEEHNRYGLDFIRAVKWIKENLPGAKVSGGVSNLSFSFRGNNYLREAMHAVFLYHAISNGMDMGIVNPSTSVTYEEIDPQLRALLEDVVLYRRPEAADELIAYAQAEVERKASEDGGKSEKTHKMDGWRQKPVGERLTHALIKGVSDYLDEDLTEALSEYSDPVKIIDGPLMEGMNRVGQLFSEGKMFLPQVVKTARTMKQAVSILQPAIELSHSDSSTGKAGKVLFATVKGDVHDIGKNIVSIVLACNNYEVIDLGVMVPAEEIVRTAMREKPDIVCLSGLITPSLDEMVHVTDEMQKAGLDIPIMVGGATTSRIHTALKIAPHYSHPVIHVKDASQNPLIAARLLNPDTRKDFVEELGREYDDIREREFSKESEIVALHESRAKKFEVDFSNYIPVVPSYLGRRELRIKIKEVIHYINWRQFFTVWKMPAEFASLTHIHHCPACEREWLDSHPGGEEGIRLFRDAQSVLSGLMSLEKEDESSTVVKPECRKDGLTFIRAIVRFSEAKVSGDNLEIDSVIIPLLRQQLKKETDKYKSLVDFISPDADYVGAFALSVDLGMLIKKYDEEQDSYKSLLTQTIAHRLAEATSEYLHHLVRTNLWGYAKDESLTVEEMFAAKYKGIRPAIGYPSLPDQKVNQLLDKLIDMRTIGITLTENGAMHPSSSISGLYISHPSSRYFIIGDIGDDQIADYAERRGLTTREVHSLLNK